MTDHKYSIINVPVQHSSFLQRTGRWLQLVWALGSRDLRARYRRSFLGPVWGIIQPIFLMVAFTILNRFINISSDGIPYAIFSYSVLVPWTFFTAIANGTASCIINNASILKKISVAREIFPLTTVLSAGFDLLMSGIVLALMMLWFQIPVGWSLLWLPLLVTLTAAFGLAIGMGISCFGIFKRDFLLAGNFLIQFGLYITPIIYPLSRVPEGWRWLYVLNPMVGILEGFRSVLARGQQPDLALLGLALPGMALVFLIVVPLFRKTAQYFADVL
jgi:lipopolysaccharide transport system permease protein